MKVFGRSFSIFRNSTRSFSGAMGAAYPFRMDKSMMKVLDGEIDTESASYMENLIAMVEKQEEVDNMTQNMMFVDDRYRELSKKRDKLLPRERVNALLDKGSPFLELS